MLRIGDPTWRLSKTRERKNQEIGSYRTCSGPVPDSARWHQLFRHCLRRMIQTFAAIAVGKRQIRKGCGLGLVQSCNSIEVQTV